MSEVGYRRGGATQRAAAVAGQTSTPEVLPQNLTSLDQHSNRSNELSRLAKWCVLVATLISCLTTDVYVYVYRWVDTPEKARITVQAIKQMIAHRDNDFAGKGDSNHYPTPATTS